MKVINVAIDGPAGAGKSTIAKKIAKELNYIYVDTGALYRAIAFFSLKNNANTKMEDEISLLLPKINLEIKFINNEQRVFLNGEDVSDLIRTPEISMGASNVSAHPSVRKFLLDLQKKIASENNIIMDGRDIGTVILPNADLKIFLTADAKERAKRRYDELTAKSMQVDYEIILKEIIERDENDSNRAVAPLKCADDAVKIDSTKMSILEVVDTIKSLIMKI
ncbi:MAG: (d)CMP kinase [Crenarchaeota archaeon]|nr:(d)CMP kinase [Thermoproteota archaeon]